MELFIGRNINLLDIVFFIKNICNVIIKYLKTNCFFLLIYRKQETQYEIHSYRDKMNEKLYQEVLDLFDPLCVVSTGLFFFIHQSSISSAHKYSFFNSFCLFFLKMI